MARPPRELVAGGVYHAVARGNRGAPIFGDEADYREYLRLLCEGANRSGWHLLAYCLMRNHVHLLVETPRPNLPAGMQWLHGRYARYFNDRHDLFGHLFQGRYKAVRQKSDEQLWHVLRYLALNPVAAGIGGRPQDYRWSSYGVTLQRAGPVALHRLSSFLAAGDEEHALDLYRKLVEVDPR